MMATEQPAGTLAETLRAAAMRVEALPADVPPPAISVRPGRVQAAWHDCTAEDARTIIAASASEAWVGAGTYMYLSTNDDLIEFWIIYPENATPAVAFSLADVTS